MEKQKKSEIRKKIAKADDEGFKKVVTNENNYINLSDLSGDQIIQSKILKSILIGENCIN